MGHALPRLPSIFFQLTSESQKSITLIVIVMFVCENSNAGKAKLKEILQFFYLLTLIVLIEKDATFWLWHRVMANFIRKTCSKPYQSRSRFVRDMTKTFGRGVDIKLKMQGLWLEFCFRKSCKHEHDSCKILLTTRMFAENCKVIYFPETMTLIYEVASVSILQLLCRLLNSYRNVGTHSEVESWVSLQSGGSVVESGDRHHC